jgi:hypothetical protein
MPFDMNKQEDFNSIEWSGVNEGYKTALTDARLNEHVRDKAALREYADQHFQTWWRRSIAAWESSDSEGQQELAKEARQLDKEDTDSLQRVFVGSFMQQYQNQIEYYDKLGHVPDAIERGSAQVTRHSSISSTTLEENASEANTRIVDMHRSEQGRVYEVELSDPTYFDEPVRVEIVVDNERGAGPQEPDNA